MKQLLANLHFIIITALILVGPAHMSASSAANQDEMRITEAEKAYAEGDYTKALHILNGIIERIEDGKTELDTPGKLYAYHISGNVYLAYNDFRNSLNHYYTALEYARTANDSLHLFSNISITHSHSGNKTKAENANNKILRLFLPDSMKAHGRYYHVIDQAYIDKFFGDRNKSAQEFLLALDIVESEQLPLREKATPYSELYEYYDRASMPDSAIFYLTRYDSIAQYFNMPPMMADSKRGLLRSYILLGDRDGALAAYNDYFSIVDSLYQPQQFIWLSSDIHAQKNAKSANRIKDLELKISIQYLLMALILMAIAICVGYYWLRRRINSFKKVIFLKDRELSQLEDDHSSPSLSGSQSRHDNLMARIQAVMKEPSVICNPDFTLQQLAAMVDSNMKYVSQAINDTEGVNFRTYLNTLRIQEARRMMLDTDKYGNLTIQAIAEAVGFKGASNFYISFKKVTGLTPSAYAKLAKTTDI